MISARCIDGPLTGATFLITTCPEVVRCVRAADGTDDILNLPDDTPGLDEAVHWYRWDGLTAGHSCQRSGPGRGCTAWINLRHAPALRDLRSPDPINEAAAR